ncbi:hypothetical protein [Desulfitobacterium hafniense]|uniref:hypothetical protein n=1 Tax=Desulfitobacterium hafniense TaxID=49338 RepID=UPI0003726669
MKSTLQKLRYIMAMLLAIILIVSPLRTAAALGADTTGIKSNLAITGYKVTDTSGNILSSVPSGYPVNLEIMVKNPSIKTSDITSDSANTSNIDVSKLVDSFSGDGSPAVTITSQATDPLAMTIKFTGIKYTGSGKTFKFMVGYKNLTVDYDVTDLTITECADQENKPDNQVTPTPTLLITGSLNRDTLKPDQLMDLTINIENLSDSSLQDAVVTLNPSESIYLVAGKTTFFLDTIGGKQTRSFTVKIKTGSELPPASQSVGVDLKYNYDNGSAIVQGTASEKVNLISEIDESSEPILFISGVQTDEVLKSNGERDVTIKVTNMSDTMASKINVVLTPSDSIYFPNGKNSFFLPNMKGNSEERLTVRIKAAGALASTLQSIGVEVKYSYTNGSSIVQETATGKIIIVTADKSPAPVLFISGSQTKDILKGDEEKDVTLQITNMGETTASDITVSLNPSDSLYFPDGQSSFFLKEIKGHTEESITVKVKAASEPSSSLQTIGVDASYSYDSGGGIVPGTASGKVVVVTESHKETDASVPYLIVSNYSYGGAPVAANTAFKLSMDFYNTSSNLSIENIVVTLETGENFSVASSSNTFYYESLGAGQTLTQDLDLQALLVANSGQTSISGAKTVEVSFKYEYNTGSKRATNTMSEKLSIPIYLPDRFELAQPQLPDFVAVGQESVITLSYVNKGKNPISNVEAAIEDITGEMETPAKVQQLGNIEAGKSSTIGFAFMPLQPGELSFTIRITYEDANLEPVIKEFPVLVSAFDAPPPMDMGMPEMAPEQDSKIPLPWLIGAAIVLLAGIGIAVMRIRKARAQKKISSIDFSWEEDAPAQDLPLTEDKTGGTAPSTDAPSKTEV